MQALVVPSTFILTNYEDIGALMVDGLRVLIKLSDPSAAGPATGPGMELDITARLSIIPASQPGQQPVFHLLGIPRDALAVMATWQVRIAWV